MKGLVNRIGLNRVAAILIGCALLLEIARVEGFGGSGAGAIACTFGEVLFISAAASVFLAAHRRGRG